MSSVKSIHAKSQMEVIILMGMHQTKQKMVHTFSPKMKNGEGKLTWKLLQLTEDLCTKADLDSWVSTLKQEQ